MSAKKESLLSIAEALGEIGCGVGDNKATILIKFQTALEKSKLTEKVNRTLNLLTYDYSSQEYFTEEKKGEFFELLNNESQENIDYVLELHQENYSSIVADAARFGYADIVKNEAWKGIKSAGNATLRGLTRAGSSTLSFVSSGWGLFGACMPQIPGMSSEPYVDPSKKLR